MQTAHELFLHELSDMLDAERNILEALNQQAEESSRPDLQKAFETHRQQTEKQVERLEQAFESLEEEPEETECKGIMGLIAEHDSFKEEDPSEDLMDIFNAAAACKVEHYEIAAYTSLINLAQQMSHNKALKLLNQNLKEELQTLKKMESFQKKLKPERLMEEEEEEDETVEGEESEQQRTGRRSAQSAKGRSRRAA
jgi:ferritin-like metal-binding protein YciE